MRRGCVVRRIVFDIPDNVSYILFNSLQRIHHEYLPLKHDVN